MSRLLNQDSAREPMLTTPQNLCDLPLAERRELLEFGSHVIVRTRKLIKELWETRKFSSELKADQTPVSEVDFRAEELVREIIGRDCPGHAVLGEEFENSGMDADYLWTIDPIDGTQNLINGIPTFGTLLGLRYRGQAVIGLMDFPALDQSCAGGTGLGCTVNGIQLAARPDRGEKLSPNDVIATGSPATFMRGDHLKVMYDVMQLHPHSRIYYDCYAHFLTATGALAAMVEYNLRLWDLTPAEALLPEAGGKFVYLNPQLPKDAESRFHAVFGRPSAVEQLLPVLR